MLQPAFVRSVFLKAKELSLTTCLDTSGHGNKEMWDTCLPATDYVMLCLKGMDLNLASFLSGVPKVHSMRAREFAKHIRDNYKYVKLSLRWVLLKDMTDTDEEINALAQFAKELNPVFTHIELLPVSYHQHYCQYFFVYLSFNLHYRWLNLQYHDLGKEKYSMIGLDYALDDMEPYKYEDALKVQEKLRNLGIPATLAEH